MKFVDYMKLSKQMGVVMIISEGKTETLTLVNLIKQQPGVKLCTLTRDDEFNEFEWETKTTLDECDVMYINFGWSDKTRELWKLLRIYSPKPVYINISNLT